MQAEKLGEEAARVRVNAEIAAAQKPPPADAAAASAGDAAASSPVADWASGLPQMRPVISGVQSEEEAVLRRNRKAARKAA